MADLDTLLAPPPGYRSRDVALFVWQLEEQRRVLTEQTRGLTVAELSAQAAPGMNTIGMLLAHLAHVEAHLVQVGILFESKGHAEDVVGFTDEETGMPLAADGLPPVALGTRDLAWFDGALARARAHTLRALAPLADADLERVIVRPRPDGSVRRFNPGWVLYHMIEHEAAHRGQIATLRRMLHPARGPA